MLTERKKGGEGGSGLGEEDEGEEKIMPTSNLSAFIIGQYMIFRFHHWAIHDRGQYFY
jgi:hypothetical protein